MLRSCIRKTRLARAVPIALLSVALTAPPAAPQACAPTPTFDPSITSPDSVIAGWPFRHALTSEMASYFHQVDAQSDRVKVGQYAASWRGTPLLYALVGTEENVAFAQSVAATQGALRDPRATPPQEARNIARDTPAIVWYSGNVHGQETSGGDAALQILYELAARIDCAVEEMRDNLLVGVIATQNPDGRDGVMRTNDYGFDMNRDWFARTQPEIDGELGLLERYPPVLFMDAHEQAVENFFFPPNDDPIHHEISQQSVHWINDLYGAALQKEFDQRNASDPLNWDYFNYNTYDLFFMGYGDSAPTTGFTAAGMTFEKGQDPDHIKQREQFVAGWTALETASANKEAILNEYYDAHRDAIAEGKAGTLEPNVVYAPGNTLRTPVPNIKIRHYFIGAGRGQAEAYHLVERLMDMGVEVYKLRKKLKVPGLEAYGRDPHKAKLPKGTFWIPMEQPQKHWIQALLGEDPYGSLVYFYDVAAWSNPLLMNVDAWFTGSKLSALTKSVAREGTVVAARTADRGGVDIKKLLKQLSPLATIPQGGLRPGKKTKGFWFRGDTAQSVAAALELLGKDVSVQRLLKPAKKLPPGAFLVPKGTNKPLLDKVGRQHRVVITRLKRKPPKGQALRSPKVALYSSPDGGESFDHLRYTLDQVWKLPYTPVDATMVGNGALADDKYDVFIVPGVTTAALDPVETQVRSWIEAGGIYVGTARGSTGGTPYAISSGYTSSSQSTPPGYLVPGSLFRVRVESGTPVTLGSSPFASWWNRDDEALSLSTTGLNPVTYPASEPDFWLSGYAEGDDGLKGTAGLVEEQMGSGRVILFSGEPNFRAYTEGPAFYLANAIAYPKPAAPRLQRVNAPEARDQVRMAQSSTAPIEPGRALQIVVGAPDAHEARAVLAGFAERVDVELARDKAFLRIANPRGLDADEHPFARLLLPALRRAGIRVLAAAL
jgi:hypothetical protein